MATLGCQSNGKLSKLSPSLTYSRICKVAINIEKAWTLQSLQSFPHRNSLVQTDGSNQ